MSEEETSTDLTRLTAEITASYVSHNRVGTGDVAGLIRAIHDALDQLGGATDEAEAPSYARAVGIRKSLNDPDRIISMIDGKAYTMLSRHLRTHGLSPEQYRERYQLPADYPMTAANYSEKRRTLAKALGLGRKTVEKVAELAEPVVEAVEEAVRPKARRAAKAAPVEDASSGKKPRGRRPKATSQPG